MRKTLSTASLALALLSSTSVAFAADDQAGADYLRGTPQASSASTHAIRYEFDPAQRDAWLADCHGKVAASGRPRSGTYRENQGASGECEAYLDDYLARYRQGQVAVPVYGYAAPGYAYVYPAQSMRMVSIPVIQAIDGRGEPIAYAEEAGVRPARRTIPRRNPAAAEASSEVYEAQ
jgi:hypothetical protein